MKHICVFCGSNTGKNPRYKAVAMNLVNVLCQTGMELVYGGSNVGLMRAVAQKMRQLGGKVTGVYPQGIFPAGFMDASVDTCIETKDMAERKKVMEEISDGFIALPGGMGTFEELTEVLSQVQLGILKKPVGILNVEHYYDSFIALMKEAQKQGFMREGDDQLYCVSEDPQEILDFFKRYTYPVLETKWKG